MQDFRPRISSSYQPRQSLSHLVSKFEGLDNRPRHARGAPLPRRTKTLPTVPPGQWLSTNGLSEKQLEEEPEVPSSSTFGQRHQSVAERRKLFEAANGPTSKSDLSSGTRVFSRDVAPDSVLPANSQVSLHAALDPRGHVEGRFPTEAVRQVRRVPRLQVARSRPPPPDEPEWPLKSDAPLRASFESYSAVRTSIEFKPTPARQRSLSRRREATIEATQYGRNPIRDSSGESGTLASGTGTLSSMVEEQERPTRLRVDTTTQQLHSEKDQRIIKISTLNLVPSADHVSGGSSGLPKSETTATSIGYPSRHPTSTPGPTTLPESKSHGILFPAKYSGSWAAKQSSSPLKDKIGMFESLSRQGSVDSGAPSARGNAQHLPPSQRSQRNVSKHAASLTRNASRIKATLRRISVTWERGHAKRLPSCDKEIAGGYSSHQDTARTAVQGNEKNIVPPTLQEDEPTPRTITSRFLHPFSSSTGSAAPPPPTPYNSVRLGNYPKYSPTDTNSYPSSGSGSDNTTSTKAAPAAATPAPCLHAAAEEASRRPSWQKRWISRSSGGPMFARVQCRLDQPMPVRGGELKRLVTLCKDRALRRSRGRTE